MRWFRGILLAIAVGLPWAVSPQAGSAPPAGDFYDAHCHLTNYVQQGPDIRAFLAVMGQRVGRSVLFGIPLQQTWAHANTGDFAPAYYLESDAPLYYYSFTDAIIAHAYLSLPAELRARFDPMITGFNPADMYAADHVRRVLQLYPGVFSGIGEFSIHKEFVSSKVAGEIASLSNPALDRLLDFAGEVGLVALIHNDLDMPFAKDKEPVYLEPMKALLARHPKTTIIWAHLGLGRVVRPPENQVEIAEGILGDPRMSHVYFDISWSEVAKYLERTPQSADNVARVINRYPDRFLFGTDEVAQADAAKYYAVFDLYRALFERLSPAASQKLRTGNYQRLFDEARRKVRAWEKANLH